MFRGAPENRRRIVVNEASLQRQLETVRRAASDGAFVIAYLHHHHWEPSWRDVPEWVESLARACVDAGAGTFVSHGAPVLQPIEIYRGAPIFYGLGNFLFHLREGEVEWSSPDVWKSIVAICRFDDQGRLRSISLVPIVIGGEQQLDAHNYHDRLVPIPASEGFGSDVLKDLARRSEGHGVTIVVDGGNGTISADAKETT